jgi:hypothetical protein
LRTFKRSRDPSFATKLTDIVGLYIGMQRPITVPSSTLRAANRVVVPWRL